MNYTHLSRLAHLTVLTAVSCLAISGVFVLGDLDRAVKETSHNVNFTIGTLNTAALGMSDSAANLETTLSQERAAMAGQLQETDQLLARMNAMVTSVNTTVQKSGDTMDALGQAVEDQDHNLSLLEAQALTNLQQLEKQEEQLGPLLYAGTRTLQDAELLFANPDISATLAHINHSAANVDQTTADFAAFVHRETTPIRGTWNVLRSTLEHLAAPAANVATAIK